ncbi:MAG: hypothetical protein ACI32Y_06520, partial [Clostridium sp.]
KIVKCFPLVYGASAMRGVLSRDALDLAFENAQSSIISEYSSYMGISLSWNDNILSDWIKILVLMASGFVFMILSIFLLQRKQIRDR